ncbi:TRAP transporter fused permease subunit [Sneathiella marina]|uniref:TRAP transporter fused permease subunit n=1 Tax=Sneathiella marina TaxID=2950108 RepID=A0ABY4W636_9PROT|nr:TRAP transporter fused permease subunit [Sneathiella marina]USG62482.1 TRAP transporter fused permease subunit [Sneathiella marina]
MNSLASSEQLLSPFQRSVRWVLIVAAVCMVVYHLFTVYGVVLGSFEHQNLHLAFLLVVLFLDRLVTSKTKTESSVQFILIFAAIGATTYVGLNMTRLEEDIGFPEPTDIIIGLIAIAVCIEATRQAWGWTLPIVAAIFIAYFFLGHYIPGPLSHRNFNFEYVISYLSIGLTGLYGNFLAISANQIFLFVLFGSLMGLLKISDFLSELSKMVSGRMRGGPGLAAVISSSMIGMVTGASVANVAITGAFTIPYMKKVGYKPALAGAIEATASTGGQLMPPVMGAAAFLMAFFVGVPYADIMIAGIVPAVLFYICVFFGVQSVSVISDIKAPKETADRRIVLIGIPSFVIPVGLIALLLMLHYSTGVAAFWAIVSCLCIAYIRKDRPSARELLTRVVEGAVVGAKIGVSLAIVGIISQSLITTGLGGKIAGLVELLSAGNLHLALIMTMVVAIILGCGVPPAAAYSLVAIVVAPTLVKMGVPILSAHFFCFYFAIISAVTPPVALGALAGAGIARAPYFATAFRAFVLSLSGFIIPYLIVYNPVILLSGEFDFWGLGSIITVPIALISCTLLVYRAWLLRFSGYETAIGLAAMVIGFSFSIFGDRWPFPAQFAVLVSDIALFGLLALSQRHYHRKSVEL